MVEAWLKAAPRGRGVSPAEAPSSAAWQPLPAATKGTLNSQPGLREQGCSRGPGSIRALIIIVGAEVQTLTFALFNLLIYLAASFLSLSSPAWVRTE